MLRIGKMERFQPLLSSLSGPEKPTRGASSRHPAGDAILLA
jgi:hypothetical protein